MATWICTPTTVQPPGQALRKSKAPVEDAWLGAKAGDRIELEPGDYRRWTLKKSAKPKGSVVTIKSLNLHGARVLADPLVGSTDSIMLKGGLDGLILDGIWMGIDDRAALKTEPGGASKVTLINCKMEGNGAGPIDSNWNDYGKWGGHHYETRGWAEVGTVVEKVFQEHGDGYFHSIQGNHAFSNCSVKWCGRTGWQFVSRVAEGPIAKGDVLVENCYAEDVCLEQNGGGTAFSVHGGHPTSTFTLRGFKTRLGGNPQLARPFSKNITGSVMFRQAADAHPGGTKKLVIEEVDCEVGQFFPGENSARRPNFDLSGLGEVVMYGDTTRIIQHPGADRRALVLGGPLAFHWSGSPNIEGEVHYKGRRYLSWDAFANSPDGSATRL